MSELSEHRWRETDTHSRASTIPSSTATTTTTTIIIIISHYGIDRRRSNNGREREESVVEKGKIMKGRKGEGELRGE